MEPDNPVLDDYTVISAELLRQLAARVAPARSGSAKRGMRNARRRKTAGQS